MNRPTISHAGIFVALALAIGIASYRSSSSILGAICVGIVGSLILSGLLIRLDKKVAARLNKLGLHDRNYPAEIDAVATVRTNPESAMTSCRAAIESLPNFGTIKNYEAGKLLEARTRRSRESWGEKISVRAEPSDGGTKLQLRSVPVLWTVTEDMHYNYQNVALILKHLQREIEIDSVQPEDYFKDIIRPLDGGAP